MTDASDDRFLEATHIGMLHSEPGQDSAIEIDAAFVVHSLTAEPTADVNKSANSLTKYRRRKSDRRRGDRCEFDDAENALNDLGDSGLNLAVGPAAPEMAHETAELLRSRLLAASQMLLLALGLMFVGNVFWGTTPLPVIRGLVLVFLIGIFGLLKGNRSLTLSQLRSVELGLFGTAGLQLVGVAACRFQILAAAGQLTELAAAAHGFVAGWFAIIMLYGMFIPNRWRRAAVIVVPAALVPVSMLLLFRLVSPEMAVVVSWYQLATFKLMMFIGAVAAVFGTHTIRKLRVAVFEAKTIGQYRLKRRLGSGGMGEVFLAEHRLLKRPCAIKLIRMRRQSDRQEALLRFEREVRITAQLSHWNTVEVFDYGCTDDGTFYYVMEYLPGMSLDEIVRKYGPLPPERVVHFLSQTCQALREAHSIGFMHRDIKPANIFAAQRGGRFDVAKLLDFGLVKPLSGDWESLPMSGSDRRLTQFGTFTGSPLFMSPEQASAEHEPDARSDIYSLCAVAYYLLTGRPPFDKPSPLAVIIAHARDDVAAPSRYKSDIPHDLEQAILKGLAKAPQDRYQDAESFAGVLSTCECASQWTDARARDWWQQHQ